MKKQIYTLFFLVIFSSLLIGQENTSLLCSDGIDNDEDGLIDCDDLECIQFFHNSCIICNEGSSYADEVIEYVPGCPISDPNPEGAVGLSDYQGGTIDEPEFVFLGQGGHLSLGFTNNVLINSGDSQIDFYVFEVGPAVEPCEIFLRPADIYTKAALQNAGFVESGIGFFKIGDIGGSTSGLDIDNDIPGYALGLLVFDAIKIKDIEDGGCSSVVPGADIDAVCAIYSKSLEFCSDGIDNDGDGLVDCNDPDIADDCCCKEALILDLGENIQVCEGDQLLLEADSLFATYLWGDGSTTSTIFATEQKWYHLTVTDECENISIDSVYLTVLNTKTTHLDYKICEGDSILINEIIYYDTGNYTQDLKNQYGCDSVLTIFISIIDRHEAMFQFDTVNCNNEFTFFTILEEPNDDVAWFLNGEYYSSLPSEVLTITESVAIELKLVLNPNTSCSDSMVSYYQLEYLPPIELINNNPGKLCLGEIITLYSNTNNGNRWILNGIDFGEENEISFNLLEPSFVKLYNVFQPCNDTIIISFDMTQRVPAVFTFDRLECPNQFILQNIPSSSNTDVLWLLDGEYFSINYNDTISIAESKPIKLTLITNPNTYCADTSSVIYDLKYTEPKDELYISPNIFSPNNDGINDFYCPLQYIDPDRKGNFLIFDRWGNLMFQSISFADCWDGKFDGRRVEEGVYTVKITIGELIDCGQVYKKVDGYQTITLIK